MKLLLDEHFSSRIAADLRGRGHDVVAVTEEQELRGLPDAELFEHARSHEYILVTQDYADFTQLVREAAIVEAHHPAVVFVPARLWRSLCDRDPLSTRSIASWTAASRARSQAQSCGWSDGTERADRRPRGGLSRAPARGPQMMHMLTYVYV